MEQYSRRECVEILGIPVFKQEDTGQQERLLTMAKRYEMESKK